MAEGKKIFIAEDNRHFCELYRMTLGAEGHEKILAARKLFTDRGENSANATLNRRLRVPCRPCGSEIVPYLSR